LIYLLSDEGRAAIAALRDRKTLLAFDFDGTLAPIERSPDAARLPADSIAIMQRLCAVAPVAIITGRSVADVSLRLGFKPRFVVGNHGSEGLLEMDSKFEQFRSDCRHWRTDLQSLLAADPEFDGVTIEDKGLSLSVHYRNARRSPHVTSPLMATIRTLAPAPRIVSGKFVINLVPEAARNKHDALVHLKAAGGFESALFIGDDETDEDVFRGAPAQWLTVRIDPVPTSAARYCLRSQSEMPALLETLVEIFR
jgi:trehalose 6-phosphate phosphatase